jgi:hypothetical protein
MKRTAAIIAFLLAIVFLAVGLLFLCAAINEPSRLLLAALLLVIGAGLAVASGLALRRLRDLNPENLDDRIVELARRGNGEVTLAEVVAELRVPDDAALAALNLLERRGQARRERRAEREFYVFPGLKPVKVQRKCPYCGTELSVKTPLTRCPNCGGDLRLVRE